MKLTISQFDQLFLLLTAFFFLNSHHLPAATAAAACPHLRCPAATTQQPHQHRNQHHHDRGDRQGLSTAPSLVAIIDQRPSALARVKRQAAATAILLLTEQAETTTTTPASPASTSIKADSQRTARSTTTATTLLAKTYPAAPPAAAADQGRTAAGSTSASRSVDSTTTTTTTATAAAATTTTTATLAAFNPVHFELTESTASAAPQSVTAASVAVTATSLAPPLAGRTGVSPTPATASGKLTAAAPALSKRNAAFTQSIQSARQQQQAVAEGGPQPGQGQRQKPADGAATTAAPSAAGGGGREGAAKKRPQIQSRPRQRKQQAAAQQHHHHQQQGHQSQQQHEQQQQHGERVGVLMPSPVLNRMHVQEGFRSFVDFFGVNLKNVRVDFIRDDDLSGFIKLLGQSKYTTVVRTLNAGINVDDDDLVEGVSAHRPPPPTPTAQPPKELTKRKQRQRPQQKDANNLKRPEEGEGAEKAESSSSSSLSSSPASSFEVSPSSPAASSAASSSIHSSPSSEEAHPAMPAAASLWRSEAANVGYCHLAEALSREFNKTVLLWPCPKMKESSSFLPSFEAISFAVKSIATKLNWTQVDIFVGDDNWALPLAIAANLHIPYKIEIGREDIRDLRAEDRVGKALIITAGMNDDSTLRLLSKLATLHHTKVLLIDIVATSLNAENRFYKNLARMRRTHAAAGASTPPSKLMSNLLLLTVLSDKYRYFLNAAFVDSGLALVQDFRHIRRLKAEQQRPGGGAKGEEAASSTSSTDVINGDNMAPGGRQHRPHKTLNWPMHLDSSATNVLQQFELLNHEDQAKRDAAQPASSTTTTTRTTTPAGEAISILMECPHVDMNTTNLTTICRNMEMIVMRCAAHSNAHTNAPTNARLVPPPSDAVAAKVRALLQNVCHSQQANGSYAHQAQQNATTSHEEGASDEGPPEEGAWQRRRQQQLIANLRNFIDFFHFYDYLIASVMHTPATAAQEPTHNGQPAPHVPKYDFLVLDVVLGSANGPDEEVADEGRPNGNKAAAERSRVDGDGADNHNANNDNDRITVDYAATPTTTPTIGPSPASGPIKWRPLFILEQHEINLNTYITHSILPGYDDWLLASTAQFWHCGAICWTIVAICLGVLVIIVAASAAAGIAMRNYLLRKRLSKGPNKIVLSANDFVFPVDSRRVSTHKRRAIAQRLHFFGAPESTLCQPVISQFSTVPHFKVDEGIEAMLCCWLQQLQEFGGPEVDKPDLLKGSIGSLKNLGLFLPGGGGLGAPSGAAVTGGGTTTSTTTAANATTATATTSTTTTTTTTTTTATSGTPAATAANGKTSSTTGSLARYNPSLLDMRARYNGDLVQLKEIPLSGSSELKSKAMDLLVIAHGLRHENINPLIGWLSDPNRTALVFDYCSRGSLQDVLIMDEIKLDWSFRLSLLTDLVRGMRYLHTSPLRVHGTLTSRNCVVDARWVLKITDYGLTSFHEAQGLTPPARSAKELLWTAPELLRAMKPHQQLPPPPPAASHAPAAGAHQTAASSSSQQQQSGGGHQHPHHSHQHHGHHHHHHGRGGGEGGRGGGGTIHGTQMGDVYSFGIIMQEVVVRGEPYCMLSLSAEEIIGKIKKPPPLIRPSVSKGAAPPEAINIMRQCWAEQPEMRPDFNLVYERFKMLNHGRKVNFVDTMFQMLEKYSNNLEELIRERTEQLDIERKKTEQLLNRMLPSSVAEKLKMGLAVDPEEFSDVTIYFSDIVGFTTIAAHCSPVQVVDLLNDLYTIFDATINAYNVYKVETIGDAYMVVSGLPVKIPDHAEQIATMALDLLHQSGRFDVKHLPGVPLQLRIGLHTGPCCAGVVGLTMPRYCLFGDTVNTASRMESTGSSWRIHMSQETRDRLEARGGYMIEPRGLIDIKGKGMMSTFWLLGKKGFDKPLPAPPPIGESHGLDESFIRNSITLKAQANKSRTSTNPSSSQSSSLAGESVEVKVEITPPTNADAGSSNMPNSYSNDSNSTTTISPNMTLRPEFPTKTPTTSPQGRKMSELTPDGLLNPGTFNRLPNSTAGSSSRLYKKLEEMMDLSLPYNHYKCLSPSESNLTAFYDGKYLYSCSGGSSGGGSTHSSSARFDSKPGSSRLLRRQFSLDRDDTLAKGDGHTAAGSGSSHHHHHHTPLQQQAHHQCSLPSSHTLTGNKAMLDIPILQDIGRISPKGTLARSHKQNSTSIAQDLEKIEEIPLSPASSQHHSSLDSNLNRSPPSTLEAQSPPPPPLPSSFASHHPTARCSNSLLAVSPPQYSAPASPSVSMRSINGHATGRGDFIAYVVMEGAATAADDESTTAPSSHVRRAISPAPLMATQSVDEECLARRDNGELTLTVETLLHR